MARPHEEVRDAQLMDAAAREQWYNSLERTIFRLSAKNIMSTFEQLHLNKGEVFERGVINVFKGLAGILRKQPL
jgi:hypothetical protein